MLEFHKWKLDKEMSSSNWACKMKKIKMNFLLDLWMLFVFIRCEKSTIAKCDVFCHAIQFISFRPSVLVCRLFCTICCSYLQTGIENICRNILHIKYVRLLFFCLFFFILQWIRCVWNNLKRTSANKLSQWHSVWKCTAECRTPNETNTQRDAFDSHFEPVRQTQTKALTTIIRDT